MTSTRSTWLIVPALLLLTADAWAAADAATKTTPAAPVRHAPAEAVSELQSLLAAGRCDDALAKAGPLAATFPDDPDLLVVQANCALRAARTSERRFDAIGYERMRAGRTAEFVPPGAESAFFRLVLTFEPKAREGALRTFRRAMELEPSRSDLVVGNIAALLSSGGMDDAIALLRRASARIDQGARADLGRLVQDLLQQGADDDAARFADALAATYPGAPVALRAQGLVALARHDGATAAARFLALAKQEPTDVALVRQLAQLLLFARRWDDAVSVLAPVADQDLDLQFWLALARMRSAPGSALPLFRDVGERLRKEPHASKALLRLCDHYTRALADPRRPTVAMRLRAANEFAKSGVPVAAVAELDDALAQQPHSAEAWKRLSDLYRDAGLLDLAATALDGAIAAVAAAPADAGYSAGELQAERGRVLFAFGHDADAAAAYAAARKAGHPVPYEEGLTFWARGRNSEAKPLFEEAIASGGPTADWAKSKLASLK